jgi:serine/threonine protein kinase
LNSPSDDEPVSSRAHPSGVIVPSLVEGQLTFDRYRLKKLLGRGGFGVVWLVYDEELQMDVALKFLSELLATDPEAVADLKRETRNSLKLTHTNIMRIYGFVQKGNMAGISMEYVDGDTLSGMKVARPERCLAASDLAPYVTQLCDALDYAHLKAQVVHRDLKPANLMTNSRNELKIADFGISRSISDTHTRMTDFTSSSGTPAFMSPQQMMGESPSAADDVYSMGATLYDLLSGKPPFYTGDIVQQVWRAVPPPIAERRRVLQIEAPPVPPEWEEVIAACLAKEPEHRPPTAGAVAEFLGLKMASTTSVSDYTPITLHRPVAPPPAITPKSKARIIRDWTLLGLALAGLLMTFLLARPPVATIEPATLDFGTVLVGDGSNLSFTITNTGGRKLLGNVLAACPDFAVLSGSGEFSLKANESRKVTVRFSPRENGRSSCTVALGGNISTPLTVTGLGENLGKRPPARGQPGTGSGPGTTESGASQGAGVRIEPRRLDFLTRGDLSQIRSLMQDYEAALEDLDAKAVTRLWAAGRGPGETALEDSFSRYKSQEVTVSLGDIRMDGPHATAPVTIRGTIRLADGTTRSLSQKGTVRFVRTNDRRWLIHEMRVS